MEHFCISSECFNVYGRNFSHSLCIGQDRKNNGVLKMCWHVNVKTSIDNDMWMWVTNNGSWSGVFIFGLDLVFFCCRIFLFKYLYWKRGVIWIWCNMIVPCRFQRPPGVIPSSMLGLETVTGSLDHFGFEDFLNGDMTCFSFFFWQLLLLYFL